MATVLNNLATLLQLRGRFEEAEPLLLRALEIDEKTVGKEHVNIATRLNNLAVLHVARREFCEAEGLFRQSLEIIERCFPKDHPRVALALNNLADVLHASPKISVFRMRRDELPVRPGQIPRKRRKSGWFLRLKAQS